jgi:high-affinity nickel permease
MFGLDDWIAHFSDGATLLIVIGIAVMLGLRHATDPDHLAAVTTLIASGKERTKRAAARLGFAWGLGHATTLFAFGLPIVLFKAYLPERVQQGAEATIGVVIVALAAWLLVRWRRGLLNVHVHAHEHGAGRHLHAHDHAADPGHAHRHTERARSPLQAFGIGLLHGLGGSAGVGILLLAAIHNRGVAVVALALFAFFTAVSMALLSTGFGLTLSSDPVRRSFNRIAPALGMTSLLFGVWYALGAFQFAPYYF